MKNRKISPILIYVLGMFLLMSWVSGLFGDGTDGLHYSEVVSLFQDAQVKSFEVQDDIIAMELHTAYSGKTSLTASIGDADQFREEMNDLFLSQKAAGILENYHFTRIRESIPMTLSCPSSSRALCCCLPGASLWAG